MIKTLACALIAGIVLFVPMEAKTMGNNGLGTADKYEPWECAFERDHVPPITPEAESLFREARDMQRDLIHPTENEKIHVFSLYKQAAELGHWKAMNNLANCYLKGWGTEFDAAAAIKLYDAMMEQGIPVAFYGKSLLLQGGYVIDQDKSEAKRLLHKAADLGSPIAQFILGEHYIYKEKRDRQGLAYHICALAQGYARSGKAIGDYLSIVERNYPMVTEYYWRGAALGDHEAAFGLREVFGEAAQKIGPPRSYGFEADPELSRTFYKLYREIKAEPRKRYPNLFTEHPIPNNPLISREQSRNMPSKLRDLYHGKWPDETLPELAPGYVPPLY